MTGASCATLGPCPSFGKVNEWAEHTTPSLLYTIIWFKGGTVDSLKEGVFVWGGVILGGTASRETVYITHTLGIFGWGLDETIYLTTVNKNAKKWGVWLGITPPNADYGNYNIRPICSSAISGVASLRKNQSQKTLLLLVLDTICSLAPPLSWWCSPPEF